jgi:integrase
VSETTALRYEALDLRYATARIQRSRVQGHEAGTKTQRSNREIHLHENLVEVLKAHTPLHVRPDAYVFTTVEGSPISEDNFYHREWLPMLRRLTIRPRPFYNTRHSYISFLLSIGAKSAFVSSQTGDSIRTLENHYAKYLPGLIPAGK